MTVHTHRRPRRRLLPAALALALALASVSFLFAWLMPRVGAAELPDAARAPWPPA